MRYSPLAIYVMKRNFKKVRDKYNKQLEIILKTRSIDRSYET